MMVILVHSFDFNSIFKVSLPLSHGNILMFALKIYLDDSRKSISRIFSHIDISIYLQQFS